MDTCNKIKVHAKAIRMPSYGRSENHRQRSVGYDHCPVSGSAAKFIATTMEIFLDARVYDTPMITVWKS